MKATDTARGATPDGRTQQPLRDVADALTAASPTVRRRRAAAAWERWSVAAGPWRRWTLCLPLVGPGLDELDSASREAAAAGERSPPRPDEKSPRAGLATCFRVFLAASPGVGGTTTARCGPPLHHLGSPCTLWREASRLTQLLATRLAAPAPRTLVVLDVAPVVGVLAAAAQYRLGRARPALCLGRWPYAEAVLPARPLVDVLLVAAPQHPTTIPEPPHVVLVLDGQRGQPVARHRGDPRADNRFELASEDLPDTAMLASEGISQVLDARAEGEHVPEALRAAYAAYASAGQAVEHLGWKPSP